MVSHPKPVDVFHGWTAHDSEGGNGKMVWEEFKPKKWEETDVDIKISHCGVCGSDIHTLRSGWGKTDFPCVPGHEIVGTAIRVGKEVKEIKVGDRVGVGAQVDSCFGRSGPCDPCDSGLPQFCENRYVMTYDSKHANGDKAYGGYATHIRSPAGWVIPIPKELASEDVASMLCGGVTAYRPLKANGVGPGKKVAIIGIGGIGHYGILWAKALGADEIVAVSRSRSKEADARKLGATKYIATQEEDWLAKNRRTVDVILLTVSNASMPLNDYLWLLRPEGRMVMIGAPEDSLPQLSAFSFLGPGGYLGGSRIGSPQDIKDMLALAVEKKVKPWVNVRPMSEANKAVVEFEAGKPRYRFVLENKEAK